MEARNADATGCLKVSRASSIQLDSQRTFFWQDLNSLTFVSHFGV